MIKSYLEAITHGAPADYLKLVSSGGMPILAQDAIFSKNAQKLLKL